MDEQKTLKAKVFSYTLFQRTPSRKAVEVEKYLQINIHEREWVPGTLNSNDPYVVSFSLKPSLDKHKTFTFIRTVQLKRKKDRKA